MVFRVKVCLFLLLSFAIFCSTSSTISLSGDETVLAAEGRSLTVSMEDYDEPTANRGYDPPFRTRGIGGNGGGGRRG